MSRPTFETRHFINNEFVESEPEETYVIRNPANDEMVATIPVASESEVDAAVKSARAAFEGEWGQFNGAQRAKCMAKFADLLEQHANKIAELDTLAIGMPYAICRGIQVSFCVNTFRYYAGLADKISGETYPPDDDGYYKIVQYEPLGVCAGIASWNFLLVFVGWKIAPALAAGNTFIFKASEKAPLSCLAVAPLFKEAGFPPGAVNFVSGGAATGAMLASHTDIDKISFTGSVATGRKVQDAATKSNLKHVTLELGGKSPAIFFDDADLEPSIKSFADGFLLHCGQICFAATRAIVHKSITEPFVNALKGAFTGAASTLPSDTMALTTLLGPLGGQSQLKRVLSYVDSGKQDAELVCGGSRIGTTGCFVEPTIFLNPSPSARILREEVFGPVLCVQTFENEEDAIKLANDTDFGLSSCIYTKSITRAFRVSRRLKAGTVAVNASFLPDDKTPFGGFKQSGIGRECGKAGLESYLQAKTVKISMNA